MPDILLIGNPRADLEEVKNAQTSLSKKGVVGFEQLDRLSHKYSTIVAGSLSPHAFSHSPFVLGQFAKTLKPSGTLELCEPCLLDSGALLTLQAASKNHLLPLRTERSLQSELIMLGFVNIQIVDKKAVGDALLDEFIELWGIESEEKAAVRSALQSQLQVCSVTCQRPSYVVGSGAKLSFGKKKTAAPVAANQKAVWTVSSLDDDVELENEDDLLDESDLIVPPTAPAGDCSTRKKACKDCSCGRAEEEEREIVASITVVAPKKI
ncbi:Anamorsin, partial [Kappamyces sp. JEL0680]